MELLVLLALGIGIVLIWWGVGAFVAFLSIGPTFVLMIAFWPLKFLFYPSKWKDHLRVAADFLRIRSLKWPGWDFMALAFHPIGVLASICLHVVWHWMLFNDSSDSIDWGWDNVFITTLMIVFFGNIFISEVINK